MFTEQTFSKPPLIFNIQKIDGQPIIIFQDKIVYFMPNSDIAMPNLKSSISLSNGQMVHTTMTLEQYSQLIAEHFFPQQPPKQNIQAVDTSLAAEQTLTPIVSDAVN